MSDAFEHGEHGDGLRERLLFGDGSAAMLQSASETGEHSDGLRERGLALEGRARCQSSACISWSKPAAYSMKSRAASDMLQRMHPSKGTTSAGCCVEGAGG